MRDADATLILTLRELDSGSRLTADIARRLGKPYVVASLGAAPETIHLGELLPFTLDEVVLNIAGPRESSAPGIYARAFGFLVTFFRRHARASVASQQRCSLASRAGTPRFTPSVSEPRPQRPGW